MGNDVESIVRVLYTPASEDWRGVAVKKCPRCGDLRRLYKVNPKGDVLCAECIYDDIHNEYEDFKKRYGRPVTDY